ncbi:MAG: hypothetical protein J0L52_11890 [Caulobacterales bacterium]|nr:hypothetical protein [Caulobacterales bacterium]
MTITVALVAGVAGLLMSSTSQAEDISQQSRDDLTCFAVFAAIYGTPNSEMTVDERQAIGSGITYYLGRLEGREPQIDWLAYLQAHEQEIYSRVLDEQQFNRCATEFTAVGARMAATGSN